MTPKPGSYVTIPLFARPAFERAGFTEGLLQLSIAIWIIDYPIVMPFAANREVGELRGGGG